jgi:hypothetical protein
VLELLVGQGLLQESKAGIRDREATVELTAGNIDIEGLEGKIMVSVMTFPQEQSVKRRLLTFPNHSSALSGRL